MREGRSPPSMTSRRSRQADAAAVHAWTQSGAASCWSHHRRERVGGRRRVLRRSRLDALLKALATVDWHARPAHADLEDAFFAAVRRPGTELARHEAAGQRLRLRASPSGCVGAALMPLVVAFYPSVRDDPSLNSIYARLSASTQALLGGSDLTVPGRLPQHAAVRVLPSCVLLVSGSAAAPPRSRARRRSCVDLPRARLAGRLPRTKLAAAVGFTVTIDCWRWCC